MSRISFVLFLAVMASAFVIVRTQYESRQLTTELDRAKSEARRIETDLDRLEVERRAQATPLRIEQIARQQLQMRPAGPGITQYVLPNGQVAPAVQAASEAAGGKP